MSFCYAALAVSRSLPPLNPLHVFDVAARLGNFTLAAEELNVSQSAVSRQIAVLEGYLQQPLFHRDRRGATLTSAGAAYHREIGPAFSRITNATQRMRQSAKVEPLHLQVYHTFAAKWLIGRLPRFEKDHPEINVRISTVAAVADFSRGHVDMAVLFGTGDWPGLAAHRLFADELQPVCSPMLLRGEVPLREIDDLRRRRLLISRLRRSDWRDWLAEVGRPDIPVTGMEFSSSVLTYQAAVTGLGVAMGQLRLLAGDIEAGLLMPLFGRMLERTLSYYAVYPEDRPLNYRGRAFLAWLEREVRPYAA